MPETNHSNGDLAKRIINIAPDRIPEFINQSRADRSLSETMSLLNKQFASGTQREMELAEEALSRLGFVLKT